MRWPFLVAAFCFVTTVRTAPLQLTARFETNRIIVTAVPETGAIGVLERSEDFQNWHEFALAHESQRSQLSLPPFNRAQFFRLRMVDSLLEHKVGAGTDISLAGTATPAEWTVEGALPEGLVFGERKFSGTPIPLAAEAGPDGRLTNSLAMLSRLTNSATGQVDTFRSVVPMVHHVRLSFARNIYADRPNGPSFGSICIKCHGSGFPPDLTPNANTLLNVHSGGAGEQECGDEWRYIVPGSLTDSLIFQKVIGQACGARMPQGGPYFNETQIQRLARWIAELRPGDTD